MPPNNTDTYIYASAVPILTMGTIGNILTLCVLLRTTFSKKSFAVFLRALAVADTLCMWLDTRTMDLFYFDGFARTVISTGMEWQCRFHVFGWAPVCVISSWMLVLVTIERAIIVYRPHQASVHCTYPKAVAAVVFVWLLWTCVGAIYSLTATFKDICYDSLIKFSVAIVLYIFLPYIIIVTCNIMIIVRLHKARKARVEITPSGSRLKTYSTNISVMLVTNSFMFVGLTLPRVIFLMLNLKWPIPLAVLQVCEFMRRSNHAVNFLLYCVSGTLFRREAKLMFREIFGRFTCRKQSMSLSAQRDTTPFSEMPIVDASETVQTLKKTDQDDNIGGKTNDAFYYNWPEA